MAIEVEWPAFTYQDIKYLTDTRINNKIGYNLQNRSDRIKAIATSLAVYAISIVGTYFTSTFFLSTFFTGIPLTITGLSIASLITLKVLKINNIRDFEGYKISCQNFCLNIVGIIMDDSIQFRNNTKEVDEFWKWKTISSSAKMDQLQILKGIMEIASLNEITQDDDILMYLRMCQEDAKQFNKKEYLPFLKQAVDNLLERSSEEIYEIREQLPTYQYLQSLIG